MNSGLGADKSLDVTGSSESSDARVSFSQIKVPELLNSVGESNPPVVSSNRSLSHMIPHSGNSLTVKLEKEKSKRRNADRREGDTSNYREKGDDKEYAEKAHGEARDSRHHRYYSRYSETMRHKEREKHSSSFSYCNSHSESTAHSYSPLRENGRKEAAGNLLSCQKVKSVNSNSSIVHFIYKKPSLYKDSESGENDITNFLYKENAPVNDNHDRSCNVENYSAQLMKFESFSLEVKKKVSKIKLNETSADDDHASLWDLNKEATCNLKFSDEKSCVGAALAKNNPEKVSALILENTFTSVLDMAGVLLPFLKWFIRGTDSKGPRILNFLVRSPWSTFYLAPRIRCSTITHAQAV